MKKISVLLLSAGMGRRLLPLIKLAKVFNANWRNSLLDITSMLYDIGIRDVYVNHHHSQHVESFLKREIFSEWVNPI